MCDFSLLVSFAFIRAESDNCLSSHPEWLNQISIIPSVLIESTGLEEASK